MHVVLCLAVSGCTLDEAIQGQLCNASKGDLLITELMVNPRGEDTDREWFEVYNTAATEVYIDRLIIRRISYPDGIQRSVQEHYVVQPEPVQSGQHFVFGASTEEAYVNYSYGQRASGSIGGFHNTRGGIELRCGDVLVDKVEWGGVEQLPVPEEGRSIALDPWARQIFGANDDSSYWCQEGTFIGAANEWATPGQSNSACDCTLGAGELVITELMVNPNGQDALQEWIEVYNASDRLIPINRLVLEATNLSKNGASTRSIHEVLSSHVINPGEYTVLGASDLSFVDYNFNAREATLGTFANIAGSISLRCGSQELDAVHWGTHESLPTPMPGQTLIYDGDRSPNSTNNNTYNQWCIGDVVANTSGANQGTPGLANDSCGLLRCIDVAFEGEERDILYPQPGQVIISELFVDPVSYTVNAYGNAKLSANDDDRAWIELYIDPEVLKVDLNRLQIVVAPDGAETVDIYQIDDPLCKARSGGEYALLTASLDPEKIGTDTESFHKLPELRFSSRFKQRGGTISIQFQDPDLGHNVIVDQARIPGSGTVDANKQIFGWSLSSEVMNAEGNDASAHFCFTSHEGWSFEQLLSGNLPAVYPGTPGTKNGTCEVLQCIDDGTETYRNTVPFSGVLSITEFVPRADASQEWLEIYPLEGEGDLDRFSLRATRLDTGETRVARIEGPDCYTVESGVHFIAQVASRYSERAQPLGFSDIEVVSRSQSFFSDTMPMNLEILDRNGDVIESTITPLLPNSLKSTSLQRLDVHADNYCVSTLPYEDYAWIGTPAEDNLCLGTGVCVDDEGEGERRSIRGPQPGDLVWSAFLTNPSGEDDFSDRVVILNVSDTELDLNELVIQTVNVSNGEIERWPGLQVPNGACLTLEPGDSLVVGGENSDADLTLALSDSGMFSSGVRFFQLLDQNIILDSAPSQGRSGMVQALLPDHYDGLMNDVCSNWCYVSEKDWEPDMDFSEGCLDPFQCETPL